MKSDFNQYGLFLEFAKTYAPVAFKEIDREYPLVVSIEEMTEYNNQFFFIADLIQVKNSTNSQNMVSQSLHFSFHRTKNRATDKSNIAPGNISISMDCVLKVRRTWRQ
jgi:hypothetical protein